MRVLCTIAIAALLSTVSPAGATLVAHLEFDGDLLDASGFGNDGTAIGGITFQSGVIGQAAVFDATGSYVAVAHDASLNLTTGMTLAAWINAPNNGGNDGIIFKGALNATQGAYDLAFGFPTADDARININDAAVNAAATDVISFDVWTHLAATYDGSDLRLYVDGVQVAVTSFAGSISTENSPLNIGQRFLTGAGPNSFTGLIDDVRIYDNALSAGEVAMLIPEPSTGLLLGAGLALLGLSRSRRS
jgi:hypothetical protein